MVPKRVVWGEEFVALSCPCGEQGAVRVCGHSDATSITNFVWLYPPSDALVPPRQDPSGTSASSSARTRLVARTSTSRQLARECASPKPIFD